MADTVTEYGFREADLELATGKLHVLHKGAGKPVVFFHHSWGSPSWLPVHETLAANHSVYVPDMPGFGGSERPDWAREPRDLAIMLARAFDMAELDDITLVGLGFGGFVAAELACINASRLAALVLVGAAGLKPEAGFIEDQMLMAHRAYVRQSCRDETSFHAIFGEEPAEELRTLWDFSREMTARVTWKPYMFSRRLAPLLADMTLPTRLIWGEADAIVPRGCADRYAESIPNTKTHIIPGAGHLVEMEEPDTVAALVAELIAQQVQ